MRKPNRVVEVLPHALEEIQMRMISPLRALSCSEVRDARLSGRVDLWGLAALLQGMAVPGSGLAQGSSLHCGIQQHLRQAAGCRPGQRAASRQRQQRGRSSATGTTRFHRHLQMQLPPACAKTLGAMQCKA